MESAVRCSIVVPVYDSQDCLEELVKRTDEVFQKISCTYELILVNDYSRDNSWKKIKELASRYPSITGLSFRKNFGQENALMAGLRQSRGDFVVIMDDDLQHDPAYIPALLAEAENGHDVVYAHYINKKQKFWKNAGSWFNGKVAEVVLHKARNVYLSPFKVIRKEVVQEVCKYDGPFPYIDGLLFRVTSHFSRIDIEHHLRYKGTSTYTFLKSVTVWSYLVTNFSILPLRIAALLGTIAASAGILLGIIYLIQQVLYPENPAGWTSLILSVLTFGGIQLLSIGIMGEYVGRTYLNINRHPQYVIHDSTKNVP